MQNFVTVKNYIFLTANFNHILAGFVVNKDFLFATSNWKIKSHVVESQITLLVWPCLNHLQKNIAESFLMIQSVGFTSATSEAFAKAYLFI